MSLKFPTPSSPDPLSDLTSSNTLLLDLATKIKQHTQHLSDIRASTLDLEQQCEQKTKECATLEAENEAMDKELGELKRRIEKVLEEKAKLEKAVESVKEENRKMEQSLNSASS
ncbi:hypothetical protein HK102_013235 [Quaeritorhiza haematococci]|nr:hypothetical protein HK102_013235 [Quaeritorhiza haematococci]